MKFVLAALVVAPVAYLIWASWRGRVQVRCCGVDARYDKRMAAAFEDEEDDGDQIRPPSPRLTRSGKVCVTPSNHQARAWSALPVREPTSPPRS